MTVYNVTYQQFWQRRDTEANWAAANPVLHAGEIGVVLDGLTGQPLAQKMGDGETAWLLLPYDGIFFAAASGINTITATFDPTPVLYDGMAVRVRAGAANTGPATFNPNGLGAAAITKYGGTALAANDVASTDHELLLVYHASVPRWELLNPASASGTSAVPAANAQMTLRPGDWLYTPIPNANSASFWGFAIGNFTTDGASAAATLTATSTFSRQPRVDRNSSSGAGSSAARSPDSGSLVACLAGGFKLIASFGCADAATVANGRTMVGLVSTGGSPANANPSAGTNLIVVGWDSGDANVQIMHNDGSGSATKIDLGANFPANTLSTDWYEVTITAQPGATSVDVTVRRTNTGHVSTQTLSTNMPSSSTLLGPLLWRNNGTTGLAVTISDGGFYFRPNLEKS